MPIAQVAHSQVGSPRKGPGGTGERIRIGKPQRVPRSRTNLARRLGCRLGRRKLGPASLTLSLRRPNVGPEAVSSHSLGPQTPPPH